MIVTTGVGFKCEDGLVLATDTQYTGAWKLRGEKLFEIKHSDTLRVCMAGAGRVSLIRKAVEIVGKTLPNACDKLSDAQEVLENALTRIFDKYVNPSLSPDEKRASLELLVGVWSSKEGFALLQTEEKVATWVNDYGVVGTGGALVQYIVETLRGYGPATEDAKYLASYAVNMAKRYDQYSGEETRIKVLHSDGRIETISAEEISSVEACFQKLFEAVRFMLVGLNTKAFPDDKDVEWLADFTSVMQQFRERERKRREKKQKKPLA
jgi:20S proteasome alpha/beta subunit